jgi:hypothetical protein
MVSRSSLKGAVGVFQFIRFWGVVSKDWKFLKAIFLLQVGGLIPRPGHLLGKKQIASRLAHLIACFGAKEALCPPRITKISGLFPYISAATSSIEGI